MENNIVEFSNINEWLDFCHGKKSKLGDLVSPGGFAQLAGVSRQGVNNWIYRDKRVRYFKFKADTGGEFGLIPVADLKNVLPNKKQTVSEL